ncbi:MAG: FtsX-like permease family protein [Ferruginibacter sp.]|uniref:ABC transporter permease n=1 Tax=Ferruginibacter sp. TaxID=1940288 RepID=UPI00265A9582|nr:ABC transporter permease [Ferruginibacter sp.]MDB5279552.1 FtsX-like permease family protein [Ferruginibacter sp.]
MLKNYFKIAIAVLKRRKFFTFISLFGISFTLTIVIVVAALTDHVLSAGYPDTARDRELFVTRMKYKGSKSGSDISAGPSFYFFEHYVSKLKTPEKLALISHNYATSTYINNKKMVTQLSYTNDQFWDVLQYQFLEGKPYTKQEIDNAEKVAVISESTRNNYFGNGVAAVGKYIETDNIQYRITGVVKNVPLSREYFYADMFAPYTLSKEDIHNTDLIGDYTGVLLLHSKDDIDKMKTEYNQMVAKIPMLSKDLDLRFTYADSYLEAFTRGLPFGNGADSGIGKFILIISIFFLLFLSLPTLNLVNINISRIMDRYSEIGVRKAFGASSKTLVYQFIVENLIITFIGCLIGIMLSFIIIQVFNRSNIIPDMELSINFRVLLFSLFACLVFGFLSGVFPAWRMSRMQVVSALKAQ